MQLNNYFTFTITLKIFVAILIFTSHLCISRNIHFENLKLEIICALFFNPTSQNKYTSTGKIKYKDKLINLTLPQKIIVKIGKENLHGTTITNIRKALDEILNLESLSSNSNDVLSMAVLDAT